ncbi:MAG: PEP-CTERM sorting domain-containing protein [Bryobacterales bacterium]|nr:PEP-CTERM sorting domain-containing protein [Bryobacterales bacterium]
MSGPNDVNTATSGLSNNMGVAFSLANDTNNVSISVGLVSFHGGGDWNLEAYLTTQIGPGTTAASHEVTSLAQIITLPHSDTFPPFTISPFTVFSGLNLSAGNYYLTLSGTFNTANAWWVSSPDANASTTTAAGSTVIDPAYMLGIPEPYLPSSFVGDIDGYKLWFTVTGDPVDNNVPEPTTTALTLIGGLVLLHLRRSTPRHQ